MNHRHQSRSGRAPAPATADGPAAVGRAREALVAVDCEMVLTASGAHELARVTAVGADGAVLLDALVKPRAAVVDHLTRHSGITAAMLAPVETRLEQVQCWFLGTVGSTETVLVGHSLENDLAALKIVHPTVCDTATLFSSHRGPAFKPALRHLATEFLGRTIQSSSEGHCSAEVSNCEVEPPLSTSTPIQAQDIHLRNSIARLYSCSLPHFVAQDAIAALDLLLLKIKRGREFGWSDERQGPCPRLLAFAPKALRCVVIGDHASMKG